MELRSVHYFQVICEEGSFRAAADKLGVAQPTLSKAIGRLEDETGALLFDRSRRGVSLTVYGRSFLRHAKAVAASTAGVRVYTGVTATPMRSRSTSCASPATVVSESGAAPSANQASVNPCSCAQSTRARVSAIRGEAGKVTAIRWRGGMMGLLGSYGVGSRE